MDFKMTNTQTLLNYKKKILGSIDMTQTQALSNMTINHLSQGKSKKCLMQADASGKDMQHWSSSRNTVNKKQPEVCCHQEREHISCNSEWSN